MFLFVAYDGPSVICFDVSLSFCITIYIFPHAFPVRDANLWNFPYFSPYFSKKN